MLLHLAEHEWISEEDEAPGRLRLAIVFVDLASFTPMTESMGHPAARCRRAGGIHSARSYREGGYAQARRRRIPCNRKRRLEGRSRKSSSASKRACSAFRRATAPVPLSRQRRVADEPRAACYWRVLLRGAP
jgi:hypothetical protein